MIDAYRTPGPDVAAHLRAGNGLALLPFGALEMHGAHLPLGTDTAAALEVARRLAEQFDAVLLPPVHYGETWLTSGYPGTVSLAPDTVTAIATDTENVMASQNSNEKPCPGTLKCDQLWTPNASGQLKKLYCEMQTPAGAESRNQQSLNDDDKNSMNYTKINLK